MPSSGGWHFTQHALSRALDMALDPADIARVLSNPQIKRPGGRGYPDHYATWAAGRIAAIVVPETWVVVTVLWHGVEYERGTNSEPFRDN